MQKLAKTAKPAVKKPAVKTQPKARNKKSTPVKAKVVKTVKKTAAKKVVGKTDSSNKKSCGCQKCSGGKIVSEKACFKSSKNNRQNFQKTMLSVKQKRYEKRVSKIVKTTATAAKKSTLKKLWLNRKPLKKPTRKIEKINAQTKNVLLKDLMENRRQESCSERFQKNEFQNHER